MKRREKKMMEEREGGKAPGSEARGKRKINR